MANKFLVNVDLNLNELRNAKLDQAGGSTDVTAASGNKGQIYFNTGTNLAKVSNGTTIDTITNLLESISVSGSNGLTVSGISAKNQTLTLALANGTTPGALSSAFYSLLNGATAVNTPLTLVERDGSGNFAAGTITAALTGTASNATNLNNQAGSYYLARANHTGTQLAATISDFDSQVRTSRLDQMAAPTAAVSYNSQKITNLADPTNPQDAATKNYVDAYATGLDVKQSVRAASSGSNVTVTYTATGGTSARGQITAAPNTLDGVTLAANNRVLLKDQTTGAQNGIYVVSTLGTGANGVWDRATDFDQDAEVTAGAFMFVEEGTANDNTGWVLTTNNPITIGGSSGTSLAFAQFSSAGSYTAGSGITITSGSIAVKPDTTTVNANSLSVSATGVTIATTYIGQASITTVGTVTTGTWNATPVAVLYGGTGSTTAAGARTNIGAVGKFAQTLSTSTTSYTVTHSLNTTDVDVTIKEVSSNQLVFADMVVTDANNVTVTFATAPAANAYRVTVFG